MDLTKYLFRQTGSSWRIFTLPGLTQLSLAERLMAVMLGRNLSIDNVLNNQTVESANLFLQMLTENELGGYVLESIFLLKLEAIFRKIFVTQDGGEVDLFAAISRQAALEAIKFEKFDNKFVDFLDLTAALGSNIIWLKGIVASRTCYREPAQRLSGDFDCFLQSHYLTQMNEILVAAGFHVILNDYGFCNQLGVGPVLSLDNLFLVPNDELVPSAVVGYFKNRCPIVDIKFNPLDRGLKMIELDRFLSEAERVTWRGRTFLAPGLLDQLLISLCHLEKDRFIGWKQLLDIKLLADKINLQPHNWKEFVRRSEVEGLSTACCAGLSLARERLGLTGIDEVICQTETAGQNISRRLLAFTVTPLFYWNTSSLPMLLANAAVSDDSARKMNVLRSSLFPDKTFLSAYYLDGRTMNFVDHWRALILHWFVMFLPGGVVRRTFGQLVWPERQIGSSG